MEAKLAEFRARKRKEELLNKPKVFFQAMKENLVSFKDSPSQESGFISGVNGGIEDDISIASSNLSAEISCPSWTWYKVTTYTVYVVLWITLFLIAVHLEFGFVFGILSGLVFVYFNTRTGPKVEGEISAYSVFNPDFKSIDGTLKAEQFEKEFYMIKYDPNSPVPEKK